MNRDGNYFGNLAQSLVVPNELFKSRISGNLHNRHDEYFDSFNDLLKSDRVQAIDFREFVIEYGELFGQERQKEFWDLLPGQVDRVMEIAKRSLKKPGRCYIDWQERKYAF